jgi:hypothetical protein
MWKFNSKINNSRILSRKIIIILLIHFLTSHEANRQLINLSPSYLDGYLKSEQLNTIDLIEYDENLFSISVSIGYPPQKFKLKFDIATEYTWVGGRDCLYCSFETLFDERSSQTAIKTNTSILIEDSKPQIRGEITFDYINIKIFSANNLPFLIINEDVYLDGLDGVMGFGYSSKKSNMNFSILDKLYSNNQINNKLFSLKFSESSSAKLLLGLMPQEILNDMKNYTVCNVDKSIPNWNCKISHIIVGTEVNFYRAISINKSAMFSSSMNLINVPVDNIQFFMQNYFNKYPTYENSMCKIKPDGQNFYILCNMDLFDLQKAPPLHFVLNGYAYHISQNELFKEIFTDNYIRYYLFKIVFTNTPNNQWILGYSFMKHFIMVFDSEKSQVGLYSGIKSDLTKFTRDSVETVCLYNYAVYFFFSALLGLSMWYMIYKKKQDENIIKNAFIEEKNNLEIIKPFKKEKDFVVQKNIKGQK